MKDIIALVVDLGLGASALFLANSLNRTVIQLSATVKQLTDLVQNHTERLEKLEIRKLSEK
jgi:hypothetical protein